MKKIISLLLLTAVIFTALTSCFALPNTGKSEKITIGVMSGPTGMGMAKLMNDYAEENEKYAFKVYSNPGDATADLTNNTVQMLCLPTNMAASLSVKKADFISTLAINCLGSLYLLTDKDTTVNSIFDLEGKTIYASVPTSTTGPIINYILEKSGVNAEVVFEADHDVLVGKLVKNEASIVVLPEPKVSAALIQNSSYSIDLNLSTEWDKVSNEPLTMGCIVARNDFIKENKKAVNAFLEEYEASISFIGNKSNLNEAAEMIVNAQVLPKLPIAMKSLTNLYGSIVYIDGDAMEAALKGFYTAINNPQPASDFYYKK